MNRKTTLKLSLGLNAVLGAWVVFLLMAGRRPGGEPRFPAAGARPTLMMAASPSPSVSAQPEAFCWARLEAGDYRTYVKNLRRIGCPESAVRAIVTADVHAAFGKRGEELEQQLADLADAPWSARLADPEAEQSLRTELLALPDAEEAEIADLLGVEPAPSPMVAAAPPVLHRRAAPADLPPTMPLVLQKVDLAALGLNDDQKQAIASLRENFLAEIGGASQDVADPAYLARWQTAQPEADSMLQAMLGAKLYTEYQLLADRPDAP